MACLFPLFTGVLLQAADVEGESPAGNDLKASMRSNSHWRRAFQRATAAVAASSKEVSKKAVPNWLAVFRTWEGGGKWVES